MIIRKKIGKLKVNIVFRYQGDKVGTDDSYEKTKWQEKKLGVWWKTYKAVGTKYKGKQMFKSDNHRPGIMVGLNLIWANLWIDVSYGVLTFSMKK
jgi:hypothetical protein